MSRATPDDQLKFLLSCVRHSNNGKIDFIEVARECRVVSKGAAAKRYERLLKANGIHPSGGPAERPQTPAARPPKSKLDIAKAAAAKRRKIEGDMFSNDIEDEDDFVPYLKSEQVEATRIKSEPQTGLHPFAYQQPPTLYQQPLFPSISTPQVNLYNPYSLSYVQLQPPMSQSHSQAMSQPILSPPLQAASQTQLSPPMNYQHRPIVSSQPARPAQPALDDPVNDAFEEFCSQDLFKQPSFDAFPIVQSDSAIPSTHSATSNTELQVPFHPANMPSAPFSVTQHEPLLNTEEPKAQIDHNPVPVIEEPTGNDIASSILITD